MRPIAIEGPTDLSEPWLGPPPSLSKLLPENSIVLADAGAHLAWLSYYLVLSDGQHYHKPGSFGPMAWAVNGALGTKCAFPERTVVVGCGDGGYLLSGFELLTAVQYNIPVIWIVFDDSEFKLIKMFRITAACRVCAGGFHKSRLRRVCQGLRGARLSSRYD